MSKFDITRGATFSIDGQWKSGDPFSPDTSITAELKRDSIVISLTVSITDEATNSFNIYASNTDTAQWTRGSYSLVLRRTDAGAMPNGDDFVDDAEHVQLDVT